MKKAIALALTTIICASGLTACANKSTDPVPQTDVSPIPYSDTENTPQDAQKADNNKNNGIEITINGRNLDGLLNFSKPAIRGVTRHFGKNHLDGTYTVEYVHVPYGFDRDDTLDYTININSDNTFSMNVTSSGVQTNHVGHWYARRGNITFFYDEPIDPTAHNVYVTDGLYAELLPHGKIMLYDNCHTLVLSKTDISNPTDSDETSPILNNNHM